MARIGIVGTGYIAKGILLSLERTGDLEVSRVFTHSDPSRRADHPRPGLLTNSVDDLVSASDLVVVASGDPLRAVEPVEAAIEASLPVVTMDAELQVTVGSHFARRGYFSEAEGDQPGCLAALAEDALAMGFPPLVYGNLKGFLNHHPTLEEMRYWSGVQGISLDKTVAFTDGTKVQIEQALVANGLGAAIATDGLLGITAESVDAGGVALAQVAEDLGTPLSDYLLGVQGAPAGVFLTARHEEEAQPYLQYYKMGDGPYYTLLRNYHLCHLEVAKTVRRALEGRPPLLNNGAEPTVQVVGVAKKLLKEYKVLRHPIGSFEVRGVAVKAADHPDLVPLGLLDGARLTRHVEAGQTITLDDVELPGSRALALWRGLR
jgi:predicted homoserine dehydrogenase-like protein